MAGLGVGPRAAGALAGRWRIGLTGGIGSGKSTVASMLTQLGASVVDTDRIARSLAEPGGAAIDAIRAGFGADFIDLAGGMDRTRMRSAAFADTTLRRRLEAILHPLIGIETARQAAAATGAIVVFDVPLLTESATWRARVDEIWVVDCSEETQIRRIVTRAGWSSDAAHAVIASQAPRPRRRAIADVVIANDSLGLVELEQLVGELWSERMRRLP